METCSPSSRRRARRAELRASAVEYFVSQECRKALRVTHYRQNHAPRRDVTVEAVMVAAIDAQRAAAKMPLAGIISDAGLGVKSFRSAQWLRLYM